MTGLPIIAPLNLSPLAHVTAVPTVLTVPEPLNPARPLTTLVGKVSVSEPPAGYGLMPVVAAPAGLAVPPPVTTEPLTYFKYDCLTGSDRQNRRISLTRVPVILAVEVS